MSRRGRGPKQSLTVNTINKHGFFRAIVLSHVGLSEDNMMDLLTHLNPLHEISIWQPCVCVCGWRPCGSLVLALKLQISPYRVWEILHFYSCVFFLHPPPKQPKSLAPIVATPLARLWFHTLCWHDRLKRCLQGTDGSSKRSTGLCHLYWRPRPRGSRPQGVGRYLHWKIPSHNVHFPLIWKNT